MPIIATTVFSRGKIHAITVLCSQKHYEEYMLTHEVYEYSVSAEFFRKYLKENDKSDEKIAAVAKKVFAGETSNIIAFWDTSRVIDIRDVKTILDELDLSYENFIDEYANHLKKL